MKQLLEQRWENFLVAALAVFSSYIFRLWSEIESLLKLLALLYSRDFWGGAREACSCLLWTNSVGKLSTSVTSASVDLDSRKQERVTLSQSFKIKAQTQRAFQKWIFVKRELIDFYNFYCHEIVIQVVIYFFFRMFHRLYFLHLHPNLFFIVIYVGYGSEE